MHCISVSFETSTNVRYTYIFLSVFKITTATSCIQTKIKFTTSVFVAIANDLNDLFKLKPIEFFLKSEN